MKLLVPSTTAMTPSLKRLGAIHKKHGTWCHTFSRLPPVRREDDKHPLECVWSARHLPRRRSRSCFVRHPMTARTPSLKRCFTKSTGQCHTFPDAAACATHRDDKYPLECVECAPAAAEIVVQRIHDCDDAIAQAPACNSQMHWDMVPHIQHCCGLCDAEGRQISSSAGECETPAAAEIVKLLRAASNDCDDAIAQALACTTKALGHGAAHPPTLRPAR